MHTAKLNLVVLCFVSWFFKVRFLNFPAKTYQAVLRLHCNVLQGIPPHPCDHFGMKVLMGLLRWYEHWQAGVPHLEVYGPKIPAKIKKTGWKKKCNMYNSIISFICKDKQSIKSISSTIIRSRLACSIWSWSVSLLLLSRKFDH